MRASHPDHGMVTVQPYRSFVSYAVAAFKSGAKIDKPRDAADADGDAELYRTYTAATARLYTWLRDVGVVRHAVVEDDVLVLKLTEAQLSRLTGLSEPTIGRAVKTLKEAGLVSTRRTIQGNVMLVY